MATNSVKVELIGQDKGLSKAFSKAGKEASTFSKIISSVGKGLLLLGTVAIAAVVAAIAGMVAFIFKAKAAYESWMGTVVNMQRITGLAAGAASKLAGQFQLSGVDAKAGATGVYMFEKALGKAQQGATKTKTGFQLLHIALKDGQGHWRANTTVMALARDRLSQIDNSARRAYIGSLLFGRGAKTMLPWILKSADTMKEYTRWLGEAGLIVGPKTMAFYRQYREEQKHMSVLWQGFQVNAYRALVPLIGQIMPHLINIMKSAAGWMKKFATEAENKGILRALRDMVPGFKKVEEGAKKVWAYVVRNWPAVKHVIGTVANAIGDVVAWVKRNHTALTILKDIAMTVFLKIKWAIIGPIAMAKLLWQAIKAIASVVKTIGVGAFHVLLDVINAVKNAAVTAYNAVKNLLSSGGSRTGVSAGTGGVKYGHHAMGGIFSTPTLGIIGEAGPEAVIPLSRPSRAAQIMQQAGLAGAGGGGGSVHVTFSGPIYAGTPAQAQQSASVIANVVIRKLAQAKRTTGRGR